MFDSSYNCSQIRTKAILQIIDTINLNEICKDVGLVNLLSKLFVINPEQRISAEKALQHEYFTIYKEKVWKYKNIANYKFIYFKI